MRRRVNAFLGRQIEGDWPCPWIDATYVKTREARRIVSVAVIVAVGVNTDARREVLVPDLLRDKFPKRGALMDDAENDVLAFMTSRGRTGPRSTAATRWSG